MHRLYRLGIALLSATLATGCTHHAVRLGDARSRPTHYEAPDSPGRVLSVGLESQDLVSMTDRMVRDLLATPALVQHAQPPRIVIDAAYFRNESATVLNKNMLTDRLRVALSRAAGKRLVFLGRSYAPMLEEERTLEQHHQVTPGSQGPTPEPLGWDYRLGGRISSLDHVDPSSGARASYHLITFELVTRGSGVIVWSNFYELKKAALDDVVYR